MPKRIRTPPPADDEPRYLTVVHPYATNGTCNMELPKDRIDFACWVACCVDKGAFFAIFHKPSSRDMVIIEISRDYPYFGRILGEHRWAEFLQNPKEEEKGRVTKVFYCTYNTGRIVQKNGWKRIDVDETWFKAWSPKNRQIKYPYPETRTCEVPVEDRTNHSLCRPLPDLIITPQAQIAAPKPVVGSAAWIQERAGGTSLSPTAESKPNTQGAWSKGGPKVQATAAKTKATANGSVKNTVNARQKSRGSSTSARLPAVGGGTIAVKSSNVWQKTNTQATPLPVETNWDESPHVSRQGTPVAPAIPTATANQASATSQGLQGPKNAWASGPISYATQSSDIAASTKTAASTTQHVPDRTANSSAGSWGLSTSSPDSESGPDLTSATESDNPFAVHIDFSESMEEEFHGLRIRAMEDDIDGLRELDSIAPNWDEPTAAATWETDAPGWDEDPVDAEALWRQNLDTTRPDVVKPDLCTAHGTLCKKGICAEYAKQRSAAKRAAEAEKWRMDAANKGKKGSRAKGRGVDKKKDENEPTERNTTQNNVHRGPGAPVKTNWRGRPRAIVSADAIEKRETAKAVSDDGWGNSDSEGEPNVAAVTSADHAAPDANWAVPEDGFDPWAEPEEPAPEASRSTDKKPQGKKKPAQTTVSSNWADQVDAEMAARGKAGGFRTTASKRGSKRGGSTSGRSGSNAKSSVSGWGSVSEMQF